MSDSTDQSPENVAPETPSERIKDGRDTAAGCRERATADQASAMSMDTLNGRQRFETSAANWTKRADMLQRIETGIEARLATPVADDPELTAEEIAEDANYQRS